MRGLPHARGGLRLHVARGVSDPHATAGVTAATEAARMAPPEKLPRLPLASAIPALNDELPCDPL
jgi:hypothetical protein